MQRLRQPTVNLWRRLGCMCAGNSQGGCNQGLWTQPLNVGKTSAKAAAFVGAEGMDGLAGKIKVLKERKNRHGHGSPIVWKAQVDIIVGCDRIRIGL